MKPDVKIIIGAQSAYACIRTPTVVLDVRLQAGRSARASLEDSASEMRNKAAALLKRAELIQSAAHTL
jgi:hypothetical protein